MSEERYEECDRCGERYDGEDAIRSYLRDVEVGNELERHCIGCLARRKRDKGSQS